MTFEKAIQSVGELDIKSVKKCSDRLDSLTKPLGSLGYLEDMVKKLSGINETSLPKINKKATVVMCADNGVYKEGVSSCPKDVTASVVRNFFKGITGLNVFSKMAKSDTFVVDLGVDANLFDDEALSWDRDLSVEDENLDNLQTEDNVKTVFIDKKIRKGTWNIATQAAMTKSECIKAIETGIWCVNVLKKRGYNLLATGEMGICNTTTAAAVASVLLDVETKDVVGKGAGLSNESYLNKIEVVKKAIRVNLPDANDPIDVLRKVGGFDIAGLVGCFIGAGVYRIPIVIDGFISSVAALIAIKLEPKLRDFLFVSHLSDELGSKKVLKDIDLPHILNLNMRLGEGTGAVLAFKIFDAAIESYMKMGTFDDAKIEQYKPQ